MANALCIYNCNSAFQLKQFQKSGRTPSNSPAPNSKNKTEKANESQEKTKQKPLKEQVCFLFHSKVEADFIGICMLFETYECFKMIVFAVFCTIF